MGLWQRMFDGLSHHIHASRGAVLLWFIFESRDVIAVIVLIRKQRRAGFKTRCDLREKQATQHSEVGLEIFEATMAVSSSMLLEDAALSPLLMVQASLRRETRCPFRHCRPSISRQGGPRQKEAEFS